MDYKFVLTAAGPAVMGEDEVLLFGQHQEMLDYVDSDPEFVKKARQFVADNIREISEYVASTVEGTHVVGGDWSQKLFGLINSVNMINSFEYQYLPSVTGNLNR